MSRTAYSMTVTDNLTVRVNSNGTVTWDSKEDLTCAGVLASIEKEMQSLRDQWDAFARLAWMVARAKVGSDEDPNGILDRTLGVWNGKHWRYSKESSPLGLRSRATCALLNAGVKTVRDLTQTAFSDIVVRRNVGPTTIKEIRTALAVYGLSLKDES